MLIIHKISLSHYKLAHSCLHRNFELWKFILTKSPCNHTSGNTKKTLSSDFVCSNFISVFVWLRLMCHSSFTGCALLPPHSHIEIVACKFWISFLKKMTILYLLSICECTCSKCTILRRITPSIVCVCMVKGTTVNKPVIIMCGN